MPMWRNLLKLTLALFLLAPAVAAQEILILGGNGDLHSIDPNTGESTFIGATGFHDFFWNGLAQDSQGRLFAATGNDWVGMSIYEIDPNTGQGTFVIDTPFPHVGCMAFGPNDELFIAFSWDAPLNGAIYDLYTFDLNTGVGTLVGDTEITNMLGMDFFEGELYGFPFDIGLCKIDTTTGAVTDVNPSFLGSRGATLSMCFDDEGTLYYIDHVLWMMDKETGIQSPVEWINPFGFWGEAVFVEGPKPKFSLWLAGTSGHQMGVKIAGATPGGQVGFVWAKGDGGPTAIPPGLPCAGTMMDLNSNMKLLGVATADANGKAGIGPQMVPPSAAGLVYVQAIDLSTCAVSNKVLLYY